MTDPPDLAARVLEIAAKARARGHTPEPDQPELAGACSACDERVWPGVRHACEEST